MSKPSPNELYRACQDLIREGQPVFPCRSAGPKAKTPSIANGLYAATTDRSTIKTWLQTRPNTAIGTPTGIVWDVLDVDTKNGANGTAHLPVLWHLGLLNGCKKVVRTPSGGWHLYFRASAGLTNKAHAELGLDVRAKGGYVLAPPSYLETDSYEGAYELIGHTEESTDDPLMWDLIVDALAPVNATTKQPVELLPSERRASIAALREWLSIRQAGERNRSLYWAVSRCIENGIDPHGLVEPAILIGLEEEEALKTIGSALKRAGVQASELMSEAEALFPN